MAYINSLNDAECIIPGNQWIIDLLQERSRKQLGHRQYHQNAYAKAIKNIKTCPYKITNKHNAQEVVGIGPSMAKLIETKLMQRNEYISQPETQAKLAARQAYAIAKQNKNTQKPAKNKQNANKRNNKNKNKNKKKRATKEPYKPRVNSGGYALLFHMYEQYRNHDLQGFTKQQLERDAQQYSDSSFTEKKNEYYTAWKSMKKLEDCEYVQRINNGGRAHEFRLTRVGLVIAERFYAQKHGSPVPALPDISMFNETAWPRGDGTHMNEGNESNNKPKFICEYCNKEYNQKGWYEKHIQNEHTNANNKKQSNSNESVM